MLLQIREDSDAEIKKYIHDKLIETIKARFETGARILMVCLFLQVAPSTEVNLVAGMFEQIYRAVLARCDTALSVVRSQMFC